MKGRVRKSEKEGSRCLHINIDIPAFINDIKKSVLTREVSKSAPVSEKVDKFNRVMNNILDIHAPFKTKNTVCRPNTRWFIERLVRRKRRKERLKGHEEIRNLRYMYIANSLWKLGTRLRN